MQNQELLGVRAQPPDRPPTATRSPRHPQHAPPPQQRGVQGLTAGWIERAQAAGLDKAFLATVADLRRNLPDTAAAYSYLPNLPFSPTYSRDREASGSFSTIPTSSSALPYHSTSRAPMPNFPPPVPGAFPARGEHRPFASNNASTDSFTSTRTIKDADLEMAELRLAMIGMGKAMSTWLTALPSSTGQVERQGLERIKDTLLGAARRETEDIVREWGWHEGLEATSSRESTPALDDEADETDRLALKPTKSRSPRFPAALQDEETTPIMRSATFQPTQAHHRPSASLPSGPAFQDESGPSKPSLHLSSREDRPSAGLTRVPLTPRLAGSPKPPESARSFPSLSSAPATPQPEAARVNPVEGKAGVSPVGYPPRAGIGDPLAGLGVDVPRNSNLNTLGRQQSLRKSGSNDPLGVGQS